MMKFLIYKLFLITIISFQPLALTAETKGNFEFKIKEVGSPDELHMYTKCGFETKYSECHFDTGMKQTEFNDKKFYKNKTLLKSTESKDAFGKISKCDEYMLSSFNLGSSKEKDFFVKRCEGNRLHEAVLGIDYFRGKKFELNFDTNTVAFNEQGLTEGEELLLLNEGYIGIQSQTGDKKFIGLFDTGVGKTVIDRQLVVQNKDAFEIVEQSEVKTPSGETYNVGIYKAKKFTLGNKTYNNLIVQAIPFEALKNRFGNDVQAIIGNNIIMSDNWKFDLVNRRFLRLPKKTKEK